MNRLSGNRKIIKMLGILEDDKQNYPPELMHARRKKFTKRLVSLCAAKQNDDQPDLNYISTYRHPYLTPKPKNNNGNHYRQIPKPERTKENKLIKAPKTL